jgi:hypothetical protein
MAREIHMKKSTIAALGALLALWLAVSRAQDLKDADTASVAALKNTLIRMNAQLKQQADRIQSLEEKLKTQSQQLDNAQTRLGGHDRDILNLKTEITTDKKAAGQEANVIRASIPNSIEMKPTIGQWSRPANIMPPASFGALLVTYWFPSSVVTLIRTTLLTA